MVPSPVAKQAMDIDSTSTVTNTPHHITTAVNWVEFNQTFIAPSVRVDTIQQGSQQTTRIGDLVYARASVDGGHLFGDRNVDIKSAATSTGSAWLLIGLVPVARIMRFPLPTQTITEGAQARYSADSAVQMAKMRKVQDVFAKANFDHSSLGRLPAEIFNDVLRLVVQQEDHDPLGSYQRLPSHLLAEIKARRTSFSGLLQTCRHLNQVFKSFVFGRAVLYFRTPDAIQSFIIGQELAPMVTQRPDRLETVILDVRDNANWPLKTETKGITKALPTNANEWEARIQRETPMRPWHNRVDRYVARSNKDMMTEDWGNATGDLLERYGVKNLIVRGDRAFQYGLFSNRYLLRTLMKYGGCVENVMEVGQWPKRGEGALARGMLLAPPGHAKPWTGPSPRD